ncbi:protein of unknown function [Aminobacter niigataensis]|nr:protein of unknown function [Aminobacter niigataensis]
MPHAANIARGGSFQEGQGCEAVK